MQPNPSRLARFEVKLRVTRGTHRHQHSGHRSKQTLPTGEWMGLSSKIFVQNSYWLNEAVPSKTVGGMQSSIFHSSSQTRKTQKTQMCTIFLRQGFVSWWENYKHGPGTRTDKYLLNSWIEIGREMNQSHPKWSSGALCMFHCSLHCKVAEVHNGKKLVTKQDKQD